MRIGNVLLSLMYVLSLYENLSGGFKGSVNYVETVKFPFPVISVILGMCIKAFGAYSLITEKHTKIAIPLLICFTILVTFLFNMKKKWKFMALLGVIGGLINVYTNKL